MIDPGKGRKKPTRLQKGTAEEASLTAHPRRYLMSGHGQGGGGLRLHVFMGNDRQSGEKVAVRISGNSTLEELVNTITTRTNVEAPPPGHGWSVRIYQHADLSDEYPSRPLSMDDLANEDHVGLVLVEKQNHVARAPRRKRQEPEDKSGEPSRKNTKKIKPTGKTLSAAARRPSNRKPLTGGQNRKSPPQRRQIQSEPSSDDDDDGDIVEGKQYFLAQKDGFEYPVIAKRFNDASHKWTCAWIRYGGETFANADDLLPVTAARQRRFEEMWDAMMADKEKKKVADAKNKEKKDQIRKHRRAKLAEEKRAAKLCAAAERAAARDKKYGPKTDTSNLCPWEDRKAGGHIVGQNRIEYFAEDDDTVVMISEKFDVSVEKILYDNEECIKGLTKTKRLEECSCLCLPLGAKIPIKREDA